MFLLLSAGEDQISLKSAAPLVMRRESDLASDSARLDTVSLSLNAGKTARVRAEMDFSAKMEEVSETGARETDTCLTFS